MYCGKCGGVWLITLGVLILANAWFDFLNWWYAFGLLLVIGGILSMVRPYCDCGGGCTMPPIPKKTTRQSR